MAGTLVISTLSDGTNSTSATNAISGSAKAWVNFNGSTSPGTIRASYNIASITKNSTGNYTITFSTAVGSNPVAIGTGSDQLSYGTFVDIGSVSTTYVTVYTYNHNTGSGANGDSIFYTAVFSS